MVSPFLKQSWTVSAVLINMIGQGMLLSFTTTLLPALRDPESPIRADLSTASWLSSSVGLAGIPGFLISSVLMDFYGRKIAHVLLILPGLFGWLLIYFASSVPMLMAGRVLGGLTTGATVSLGAIAVGEYTSPVHRGMFLNLKNAAVCIGGMCVHILGYYLTWRTIALCATVPLITAILVISTWPESPSWLAGRQKFEKCEAAFFWLRGKDDKTQEELNVFIKTQKDRMKSASRNTKFLEKLIDIFKKFTQKDFVKPCFIIFISNILMEVSGRHLFPAYALQIIEEITGSKTQSLYFTLCIDSIIVASALFSSVLVRMMKRRTLLFSTGFAAFFVLMSVCTYIYLATKDIISKDTTVPIALFVLFFILANLGCTPIPLVLLGELYPLAHREVGSAMSGIVMSFDLMAALQLTPHLLASIKVYGTFAVFGSLMGIALVVLFLTLPETKDRTLQEIEDYFNYGNFKEKVNTGEEDNLKMLVGQDC